MDQPINPILISFLESNASNPLHVSKKQNLPPTNPKNIESISSNFIYKTLTNTSLNNDVIETTSNSFKCLFLLTKTHEKSVSLIKKHQVFIIKLIESKFYRVGLIELNYLFQFLNKLISTKPINWNISALTKDILNGLPFNELDVQLSSNVQLISLIIAFHFLLLQCLLQYISLNLKLLLSNKDPFLNMSLFELICQFFLSKGSFSRWLNYSNNPNNNEKYQKNLIKMINGYIKLLNLLIKKSKSSDLMIYKSCLILKLLEYSNDDSLVKEIHMDNRLSLFIEDLKLVDNTKATSIINNLIPSTEDDILSNLSCFISSPSDSLINHFHLSLISAPSVVKNAKFLSLVKSYKLLNDSVTYSFVGIIVSFFNSSIESLKTLSKNHLLIFDSITIFIKNLIDENSQHHLISQTLTQLYNIFKRFKQFKRIRNLSNLFYNFGNKSNNIESWKFSIIYEYFIYNNQSSTDNLNCLQLKMQKIVNTLYELNYINESSLILLNFLELIDPNTDGLSEFIKHLENFNNSVIIHLLVKILRSSLSLQNSLLNESNLSNNLRLIILIKIFELLEKSNNMVEKTNLVNGLIKNLNLNDPNLQLIAYFHYYNLNGMKELIDFEIDEKNRDSLILSGIYLQKIINFVWDESILIKSINYFERSLIDNTHLVKYEIEIFKTLLQYLKYNELNGYIIYLITSYSRYRKSSRSDFQVFLQLEFCQAIAKLNFPKNLSDNLIKLKTLLKDTSNNSINEILNFNLLQLHYCLSINNKILAKEKFNKTLNVLRSRDEFDLSSNNNVKIIYKFNNLILVAKFQLLSSKLNHSLNNYFDSFNNIKISIKLLYSIVKKLGTNIPKTIFNEIKWETASLLFESYKMIIKLLQHLGISRDLLFYLNEFKKLNNSNSVPLVNCFNYFNLILYNVLLRRNEESESHYLKINEFASCSIIKDNFNIKYNYYQINKLMNKPTISLNLPKYASFDDIPLNHLKNLSYLNNKLEFDLEYLFSLYSPKFDKKIEIDLSNDIYRQILKNLMDSKFEIFEICQSFSSVPYLNLLPESNTSLPCIISDGLINSHNLNINVINGLIKCKELLFNCLSCKSLLNLSIHELKDFNNVLNQCLSLISSMTIFKLSTNLLVNLYYLQDISRSLPFTNDRLLNHNSFSEFLPKEINTIDRMEDFNTLSEQFYKDLGYYLPDSWSIISIDMCSYSGDLSISKFNKFSQPFFLRLSLNRFNSRDSNSPKLTFDEMIRNFRDIIKQSDLSTKSSTTSKVISNDDRKNWWKLRFSLDLKLKDLLDHIENYWFGGFKSLFNNCFTDEVLFTRFKQDFNKLLHKLLPSRRKSHKFMEFDDHLIRLFFNLSELDNLLIDDLLHFVIDSLTIHGEQNDYEEINFEYFHRLFENLFDKYNNLKATGSGEHLILIPGSNCSFFPWESLSCLKNKSISRMPSIDILIRLLKERRDKCQEFLINNKSNLYYIINPGGDLFRTEEKFKPLFRENKAWDGLISEKPGEDELIKKLIKTDLFIYLGHGGCDQYLKVSTLFRTCLPNGPKLPPSLLIGCSSGSLQLNGLLEPNGNIYNWLTCGSPMIVVNLWDVTDKDIDMFSLSVFAKWGLLSPTETKLNICEAVSLSRSCCNLNYLNGSAPIVYGLPLCLGE